MLEVDSSNGTGFPPAGEPNSTEEGFTVSATYITTQEKGSTRRTRCFSIRGQPVLEKIGRWFKSEKQSSCEGEPDLKRRGSMRRGRPPPVCRADRLPATNESLQKMMSPCPVWWTPACQRVRREGKGGQRGESVLTTAPGCSRGRCHDIPGMESINKAPGGEDITGSVGEEGELQSTGKDDGADGPARLGGTHDHRLSGKSHSSRVTRQSVGKKCGEGA